LITTCIHLHYKILNFTFSIAGVSLVIRQGSAKIQDRSLLMRK